LSSHAKHFTFGVALREVEIAQHPPKIPFPAPNDFVVTGLGSNLNVCNVGIENFFNENEISSFGQNILLLQSSGTSKNPKFEIYTYNDASKQFDPQINADSRTINELKEQNFLCCFFPDDVIQQIVGPKKKQVKELNENETKKM
jgi:hypothetical protein